MFYPEGLPSSQWLKYYSRHFSTVEINNSFYHLPSKKSFQNWRESVGKDFIFSVKASRYLTHMKKLKDAKKVLRNFMQPAKLLKDKLGPILYQFPPYWHCNVERLGSFFDELSPDYIHVVEFRDPDWYRPEVKRLMERKKVGFCIHDHPDAVSPHWVTSRYVYIRLHGSQGKYQGSYTRKQLGDLADRIKGYLESKKDVFVYFNNDQFGFAVKNAQGLIKILNP